MENINIDRGLKTYSINGDENCTITFNPTDFQILSRIETALNDIKEHTKNLGSNKIETDPAEELTFLDSFIREKINYIFDGDVCTAVFGNASCLSTSGGKALFENFLDAVLPVVKRDIEKEAKKSEKRIKKYTNQVK